MGSFDWPAPSRRKWIGKAVPRVDGPAKVTGQARYTYDVNLPGMLHAAVVHCPHAHARITKIDITAAKQMPGVKAVLVIQGVDTEIRWAGDDVAAVAAVDEQSARAAARAIVVEYSVLPFLVRDEDPNPQGPFTTPMAVENVGNVDTAFAQCAATTEGLYGMPVITHCCLETHGCVATWKTDSLEVFISTQSVSGIPGQLARALSFPQNKIRVFADYVGGGYGAKLQPDRWGVAAARLSKLAGGLPVKLMLDRQTEQEVGGCRPSIYANVKVGAKADGTVLAWQSASWNTAGLAPGSEPPIPYLFQVPNQRRQHTQITNHIGSARSMRAPNHPQACLLTFCALDDLAAKLKMDPLQLLRKNLPLLAARADVYEEELVIAADRMQWQQRWKPRGTMSTGIVRRGLGVAMHTWAGRAQNCLLDLSIHPDGSVTVRSATQDHGTGTRTVLAIVVAETLGLSPGDVEIDIGNSSFPPADASGSSSTVGGVGAAARRAAVNALDQLFVRVAPALHTTPDRLEAVDGVIRVKGGGASVTWKKACGRLGSMPLTVRGSNPDAGTLTGSGVGGVQMADVSVDTETGIVTINKIVAVQDCGLIIDRQTTLSQVHGSVIMGIGYALYEEKIMDQHLGRMLNPNMEFYRLAGIGDLGELDIHLMDTRKHDDRGIIGCGEPAVISTGAAISNAVANAIGVRVPLLPLTPDRVLVALGGDSSVNSFEYTSPTTSSEAFQQLNATWGPTEVLAGGTDLLALMKDFVVTPKRLVNVKKIGTLAGITFSATDGLVVGALTTLSELAEHADVKQNYPVLRATILEAASPQIRNRATIGGNLCQRPRCWYFRNGHGLLALDAQNHSLVERGDNRFHAILGNDGPAKFVSPSSVAPTLIALGSEVMLEGPGGARRFPLERFFIIPATEAEREHDLHPNEIVTGIRVPPAKSIDAAYYDIRQKHGFDWPLASAVAVLIRKNNRVKSAAIMLGHVAPIPWRCRDAEAALAGQVVTAQLARAAGQAAVHGAKSLGKNGYKIQLARVVVQRAILQAVKLDPLSP